MIKKYDLAEKVDDYYKNDVEKCEKKQCDCREMAWLYCYIEFNEIQQKNTYNEAEIERLCLLLSSYLASWGMYVRKSFLLQHSYKIHIPIVKILLEDKYKDLYGISCLELVQKEEFLDKIDELYNRINDEYKSIRNSNPINYSESNISETLITKVLLGTIGCSPAFDENFNKGLKKLDFERSNFKEKIKRIAALYTNNIEALERKRKEIILNGINYPQMKLMDMAIWQIGKN